MHKDRTIAVIGMGYVGLPVALAFGRQRRVIAYDIDAMRIAELAAGQDRTGEIKAADLAGVNIAFTTAADELAPADFYIIAVPTPITDAKSPDMAALASASRTVGRALAKDDVVVYESTVYPGATEEVCAPILEAESGLACGRDFFIGYSPERINPGDAEHTFTNISKIVAGQNAEVLALVSQMYAEVITAGVHQAPSIKVAEAAKIVENTQRDVNIALINQLALIFERLDIDTGDVLAAAGSKWNFLPFTPGLVGGHCIGIDPYYLTYKATMSGYIPDLILAGRYINDGLASYIAGRIVKSLIRAGYSPAACVVTVLGLAFKENVADIRNSKVIDMINALRQFDITVQVNDSHASDADVRREYQLALIGLDVLRPAQAVILAVPHQAYLDAGWPLITGLLDEGRGVVFDVKSRLARKAAPAGVVLERL